MRVTVGLEIHHDSTGPVHHDSTGPIPDQYRPQADLILAKCL